jgi:uncharacterized protein YPO0396
VIASRPELERKQQRVEKARQQIETLDPKIRQSEEDESAALRAKDYASATRHANSRISLQELHDKAVRTILRGGRK